jgi:hypothetical protein
MPTLATPRGPVTRPKAKCKALKVHFFLLVTAADLSDILECQYHAEKFTSSSISFHEIAAALSKVYFYKAPGSDLLLIIFFKLLRRPLLEYIQALFLPASSFHTLPSISSNPPLLFSRSQAKNTLLPLLPGD